MIFLLLACAGAGIFMKLADDIADKNIQVPRIISLFFGLIYGLLMGFLIINNTQSAYVFSGIILGCLLTGKVDSPAHYIGLAVILGLVFSFGVRLELLVLGMVAFLAFLDEMGNLNPSKPSPYFRYRPAMKLGIVFLAATNILGWLAVGIIFSFDLAYIATDKITSKWAQL